LYETAKNQLLHRRFLVRMFHMFPHRERLSFRCTARFGIACFLSAADFRARCVSQLVLSTMIRIEHCARERCIKRVCSM